MIVVEVVLAAMMANIDEQKFAELMGSKRKKVLITISFIVFLICFTGFIILKISELLQKALSLFY